MLQFRYLLLLELSEGSHNFSPSLRDHNCAYYPVSEFRFFMLCPVLQLHIGEGQIGPSYSIRPETEASASFLRNK